MVDITLRQHVKIMAYYHHFIAVPLDPELDPSYNLVLSLYWSLQSQGAASMVVDLLVDGL